MNKRIIFSLLVFAIGMILVGCNKENNPLPSDWELDNGIMAVYGNDDREVFKSVNDGTYELVGLLGKQVVAGTNYMFLVKVSDATSIEGSYKVLIIYKNLEGITQITTVKDFIVTNYTNQNIANNNGILDGGWYVNIPDSIGKLNDDVQPIYEEAINKATDIKYSPIKVLAHQDKDGLNYAVLSYGVSSSDENNKGVYLLTINGSNKEVVSSAYIDLATFNN